MPRKDRQSTCTVFMAFLLFLRHYAVNFLRLYLVKERNRTKKNLSLPPKRSSLPSEMSTKIDPTDFSFLPLPPSTQHRSHTSLCPMCQQLLCAFVFAAQMLLLTLGNLPSDLKGLSIPLPLQNRHPRSLSSVSVTTTMLPTSHQVLHLCRP